MNRISVLLASGILMLVAGCSAAAPNVGPSAPADGAASASAASPSAPAAASVAPATSEPSLAATSAPSSAPATAAASAATTGGDGAALCALIIDINTRAGYMVDKTFQNPVTAAMTKQVILEAIARRHELLSVTPPELQAALAAELDYYQVLADWANENGWDAFGTNASAPPPSADFLAALAPLNKFQETKCGIKFG